MNLHYALAATVAGLLISSFAAPASAAPGDTAATLTVAAGALQISVPASAPSLGTHTNTVNGGTISGSLGQVQVTDARSAEAGTAWVTSVISTAFTAPTGETIIPSEMSYTAGPIVKTGTATHAANDPSDLTGVSSVVTASGITGDNTATWNPTINVDIASGTVAGTYSATLTHSVI